MPLLDSVMKDGLGGTVIAEFVVTKAGAVKDVKVIKSPNTMLAFAAEASISYWKFKPGLKHGQPVDVRVREEIAFQPPPLDVLALTGGIADTLPTPIYRAPLRYPEDLRRRGVSGNVEVEITVNAAGDVVDAKVTNATNPEFGHEAVDCIRQWKFKPAMRKGRPVTLQHWRQEMTFMMGQ